MPRQQQKVYGKRSRAVYDPFAVVGGIFSDTGDDTTAVSTSIDDAKLFKPQSNSAVKTFGDCNERRALGERGSNTVPNKPRELDGQNEIGKEHGRTKLITTHPRHSRSRQHLLPEQCSNLSPQPFRNHAIVGHSVAARNSASRAQHIACIRGRSTSLNSPGPIPVQFSVEEVNIRPGRTLWPSRPGEDAGDKHDERGVSCASKQQTLRVRRRGNAFDDAQTYDGPSDEIEDGPLHEVPESPQPDGGSRLEDDRIEVKNQYSSRASSPGSLSLKDEGTVNADAPLQVIPPVSIQPPTPPSVSDVEIACAPLLELSQHGLSAYREWSQEIGQHFHITKIAEASFGEVYRLSLKEEIPGLGSNDESVFKIIALKPPTSTLPTEKRRREAMLRKAEAMTSVADVANEVRLLQRMASTPGFTNFRDVRILHGRPPRAFIDAYKSYNIGQKARGKDTSIFPDPAKKASYAEDQLWAIIEMQDAGTDLERCVENGACSSMWSVWDIFWQVSLSLAKGEEEAQFEHRDLHLGNICVRDMSANTVGQILPKNPIDTKSKLGFTNLETTIIDYTISRCNLLSKDVNTSVSSTGTRSEQDNPVSIAYTDLDLPDHASLFTADSGDEYQYDIYRYMRSTLHLSQPLANFTSLSSTWRRTSQPKSWRDFCPATNLVWLHFVLYKLLEQVEWPSADPQPSRKKSSTKQKQQQQQQGHNNNEHAVWKRANDLEHVLLRVQALLEPAAIGTNELLSASDLIGLALAEGWLDTWDVVGTAECEAAENSIVQEFAELHLADGENQ